jgi:Tfp pilus assembly protein PilF
VAAHQAGRLDEAEAGYRQILARNGGHADALHLLGVIYQHKGDPSEAETLIRRALALKPDFADAHFNLGNLLQGINRLPGAESAYRRALELRPNFADAHINLGNMLKQADRPAEAEACYRSALELSPGSADAANNLGVLLKVAKRWHEAESAYRHALAVRPGFADAHHNLGVLLQESNRAIEAEVHYRRAFELRPESANACGNLGNVLKELDRMPEAEECYRRALELSPDSAIGCNNIGVLFMETKRGQEAESAYRRALSMRPDFVEAHQNLGVLLQETDRAAEAEALYLRALEMDPDNPELHYNYASLLLLTGELARGWQEYEYRWKTKNNIHRREYAQPLWLGNAELAGKSILLHAEQGLGDTLQFVRYAPLLAARGATVYLAVQPPLKSLAASCAGVDAVFAYGEASPPFDYQCPLMSLPLACNTVLETIPAEIPYLASSPSSNARWQEKLGDKTALRVGLTWAGNPRKHLPLVRRLDRQRSIHFDQLRPLLEVPGVEFFSLQFGDEAVAQLCGNPRVIDFTAEIPDFQNTAALIGHLDLVISVDTSVVHLAGALGKPVWLLNRYNTCWRWLTNREDSPWYPTVRIFRQPSLGDWNSVIGNVKRALEERASMR